VATAAAGDGDEVGDHRPADASPPRGRGGVHRLHLGMPLVQLLHRADPEHITVVADAEERHVVRQPGDVECVDVLGRAVAPGEVEMSVEEGPDVGRRRIIDADDELAHRPMLPARPGHDR